MTSAEEHWRSLPDELRVTPENMRSEIAEAIEYLRDRDAMIEAGTPVADAPTIEAWRASRG